jgi:hypothetical protein
MVLAFCGVVTIALSKILLVEEIDVSSSEQNGEDISE